MTATLESYITGATRYAAVLGDPVTHSQSPALHNAGFAALGIDAVMIPLAVAPGDLPNVVNMLAATGCIGASVTLPHKEAALALCDELHISAKTVGAVNCLTFVEGKVIGRNTDGDGYARFLLASKISLRRKRTLLLGGGGAARAVAYGVRDSQAIEVVAREPAKLSWVKAWPWSRDQLRELFARADFVIDCTSVAVGNAQDEEQFVADLPLDALQSTAAVASLVYHRKPALLAAAQSRGLATFDGRGMLLHQGVLAFEAWTGEPAPLEAMTLALDRAISAKSPVG